MASIGDNEAMSRYFSPGFDVRKSGVKGTTLDVTDTAQLAASDLELRSEISIWCDPSELSEIALRKAKRSDESAAARELLDLARGDRAVVREAMEHVVAGETGAMAQRALRLLFQAYQLGSAY